MNTNYDMKYVDEQSNKDLFKVVSLFAGAGGSSTGYRLAGGKVLAINEFLEEAQDTYRANYPNTHIFPQDIRELTGEMILNQIGVKRGELDILDGSPPCASFSTAGKKEKMWGQVKKYSSTEQRVDDLFYEFARLVKDIQPKVFIAENVKGLTQGASSKLLGSEQFDMFDTQENTIYHSLVNCGYDVRFMVLNAKNYYVPQSRERTIFIGVRNDLNKKISFPKPLEEINTLGKAFGGEIEKMICNDGFDKWGQVTTLGMNDVSFTILTSGLGATRKYRIKRKGLYDDKTDIEISKMKSDETNKFTINELKVICSFPNDYILTGTYAQQWERLGRSVPPFLMKAIAENVYNTILK
jgi:DNA (cytosine-5)-methyltransferase 1